MEPINNDVTVETVIDYLFTRESSVYLFMTIMPFELLISLCTQLVIVLLMTVSLVDRSLKLTEYRDCHLLRGIPCINSKWVGQHSG